MVSKTYRGDEADVTHRPELWPSQREPSWARRGRPDQTFAYTGNEGEFTSRALLTAKQAHRQFVERAAAGGFLPIQR